MTFSVSRHDVFSENTVGCETLAVMWVMARNLLNFNVAKENKNAK